MKTWPKWIRCLIVFAGFALAIILCLGGVTAVGGIPLGIATAALAKSLDIDV